MRCAFSDGQCQRICATADGAPQEKLNPSLHTTEHRPHRFRETPPSLIVMITSGGNINEKKDDGSLDPLLGGSKISSARDADVRRAQLSVCIFDKIANTPDKLCDVLLPTDIVSASAPPPTALGLRPELMAKLAARRGAPLVRSGDSSDLSERPHGGVDFSGGMGDPPSSNRDDDDDDDAEQREALPDRSKEEESSLSGVVTEGAKKPLAVDGFEDHDFLTFIDATAASATAANDLFFECRCPLPVAAEDAADVPPSRRGSQRRGGVSGGAASYLRRMPLWSAVRFGVYGGQYDDNPALALHQEVCDFIDWVRPTKAEVSMRRLVELQISDIARRLWPECNPTVYGSLSTGLLLPGSDIDMTILDVSVHAEDALMLLCREIVKADIAVSHPQLILKTKVPLVKFMHRLANVDVDISINAADGRTNSRVINELMGRFPEARPLTIVMKYFLQQRDMHEPFRGGIGSFATTLLVISFLQQHPIYTTHCDCRDRLGLGRLLVDFFRYYGTCFNFHRVGVSLAVKPSRGRDGPEGFYFLRPPTAAGERPTQVVIEDPGNGANNAASSLRYFQNIVVAFESAYLALTAHFDPASNHIAHDPVTVLPTNADIRFRPTLLSRILHADASIQLRRRAVQEAFHRLTTTDPLPLAGNFSPSEPSSSPPSGSLSMMGFPSSSSAVGSVGISAELMDRVRAVVQVNDLPVISLQVTSRLDGLDDTPTSAAASVQRTSDSRVKVVKDKTPKNTNGSGQASAGGQPQATTTTRTVVVAPRAGPTYTRTVEAPTRPSPVTSAPSSKVSPSTWFVTVDSSTAESRKRGRDGTEAASPRVPAPSPFAGTSPSSASSAPSSSRYQRPAPPATATSTPTRMMGGYGGRAAPPTRRAGGARGNRDDDEDEDGTDQPDAFWQGHVAPSAANSGRAGAPGPPGGANGSNYGSGYGSAAFRR